MEYVYMWNVYVNIFMLNACIYTHIIYNSIYPRTPSYKVTNGYYSILHIVLIWNLSSLIFLTNMGLLTEKTQFKNLASNPREIAPHSVFPFHITFVCFEYL